MAIQWSFGDLISYFQEIGVYEYFLPFLLIFAIIFAVLEKTKLFGSDKERINVVIAFVIGLVLIAQQSIVEIINTFLPRISLVFVIILMGLLIISMISGEEYKGLTGPVFVIMTIVIIIFIFLALTPTFGWETGFDLYFLNYYDMRSILSIAIPLGIFLLFTWFIFGKKSGESGGISKFGQGLSKALQSFEKGLKGK